MSEKKKVKGIAIDCGKDSLKAYHEDEKGNVQLLKFLTRIKEGSDTSDKSKVIEIDGKVYSISDSFQKSEVNYNPSKRNQKQRAMVYAAIHNFLDDGDELCFVIGLPVREFKDTIARQSFVDFMAFNYNGPVKVIVDGVSKTFTVKKVFPMFEASGAIYTNPRKYQDRIVAVGDIGGRDFNFMIFNNLVAELNSGFTAPLGTHFIEKEIKNELIAKIGTVITDSQIKDVIVKGYLKGYEEESKKAIFNALNNKLISEIHTKASEARLDLKTFDLAFIGGGAELLSVPLKENFKNENVEGDLALLNVKGYYQYLKRQLRKFN